MPHGQAAAQRRPTAAQNPALQERVVVRAVAPKDLSRPDDGFAPPSDPQAQLIGNINRLYGVPGRTEPAKNYRGTYGFITD